MRVGGEAGEDEAGCGEAEREIQAGKPSWGRGEQEAGLARECGLRVVGGAGGVGGPDPQEMVFTLVQGNGLKRRKSCVYTRSLRVLLRGI